MATLHWFSWPFAKLALLRKRRYQSDSQGSCRKLALEILETRLAPAIGNGADTWINLGSGNWDVGTNWSAGSSPAAGTSAVISTSSPATITIQAGDVESVQNLTLGGNDTLSITGGSLTLTGNTTLEGAISLSGGSLIADGSEITVTANGALAMAGGSLNAEDGATLNLPNLSSLTAGAGASTLGATGTSSTLTLASLTSLTGSAAAGSSLEVAALAGGTVTLSTLSQINGGPVTMDSDGSGSMLSLPDLATFSSTGGSITASNGGSVQLGAAVVTMPDGGVGATINVPQLPAGIPIDLATNATFSGGTTVDVAAGDNVSLTAGTFTGGVAFNIGTGATFDLTGGQIVSYSGTLTNSGTGTLQLSSGTLDAGAGGLTLDFTGSAFQWSGGTLAAAGQNVTNLGTINLTGVSEMLFQGDGTLDNYGTIVQTGAGDLGLSSDNVAPTTLKIEPGALYLLEADAGINNEGQGDNVLDNLGTIRKTAGTGTSVLIVPAQGYFNNTGTVEADAGTLELSAGTIDQVSGTTLTGGTWNALDGATLAFPPGTSITQNAGTIDLSGIAAYITGLASLAANSGNFTLNNGTDFTTQGDFTNSSSLTVGPSSTLAVAGNFTQTSASTLNVDLGGTPASGQFGEVAVSDTATLAGAFNLALVNSFSPSVGQNFVVLTFAQAAGTFASFAGLSPFFTASLNPTNLTLTDGSTNAVDLLLDSVTVSPTTAYAGQAVTVNWQVTNQSGQAAAGSWQDSVYVSATPAITSSSTLLGSVVQSGGLGAGKSYNVSLTTALPALMPGSYYVLVEVDSLYQVPDPNRANNIATASTGPLNVVIPTLTLGTPTSDSFTAADQNHYYQVIVPAGGTLVVSLVSTASTGTTALYISQGSLPTLYNYQEMATVANQPNQTVTVPQILTAGTYYILAHSVSGNAATANFTITAVQNSALTVSAVSPPSGGNAGNVTVQIDGTNFAATATASLTLGSTTIQATTVDFVSSSQLYATFNLTGATVGNYKVSVKQGIQSVTAPTTFQVVAADPALLNVVLITPQFVRSGRTGTLVINYTNETNNDLVAPLLTVSSTDPNVSFSTPDDPNNYVQSAQLLAVAPIGPAGILQPGQSGQLTLTLLSNDTIGDTIPIQVSEIQSSQTINWASLEPALKPSTLTTTAWSVVYTNLLTSIGTTTNSYNSALAQAATYLASVGDSTAEVSDAGLLWSFLENQANASYLSTSLTSTIDATLPIPGSLSLAIDRTFQSSLSGHYQLGIFGLGWTTSWQTSLSVAANGNVTLDCGGNTGYFDLQPDGSFLDPTGEYGSLTVAGGIYTYTNTHGTQYVFLPNGQLSYLQDTNDNRISLGYNGQDQLVALTYSNPGDSSEPTKQLALTYNAQDLVSQVTDGTGDIWTYTYDSVGHLLSVTGPGNLITFYTYDTGSNPETAGALLSITQPNGSQQDFAYDNEGRVSSTSQNGGADRTTYSYQGEAEVTATDAAGDQTTTWYNELGQPVRVQDARGGISNYQYDDAGQMASYTNAAGNTYQYTYDANGNLTQIVNPLGQTVQMTYNSLSEPTSLTDADGNETQYAYNADGDLLSITYPGGSQQSFTYDPLGNLTDTIEQNGDPIGYQYNDEGLLVKQTFAGGSSQTYTYDAHGNVLTANSFSAQGTPTGTTTLTYNAANELTSITYPNGQYLDFTYNAEGQRTQSVDQDGYTLTYFYDDLGRLSELKDGSGNLIVVYTYNNVGQVQEKLYGNGTYTTYTYDPAGDLTGEVNYAGGTTINSSFTYTYNVLGEQTSMTAAAGTTTYGYDATGQLTQVTTPSGQTITYVYNAAGDRMEVITGGTTTSYASNADNEITQVGSTSYTYDANGNLQTMTNATGTTTYTYNDLNQLVSVTAPDGTLTTFQYNPLGFLVGSNAGGTQTNYLVDPTGMGSTVAAYSGSNSLIANYVYGLGLVMQSGPNGTGYYDFDSNGNTVGITGSGGSYVNQYSYLPFGETTTVSATLSNPFLFGGQEGVLQIANNLFDMRARDYSPTTGQFASNDPLGLEGGDSNLRRYVQNNPVTLMDPTGQSAAVSAPGGTTTSAAVSGSNPGSPAPAGAALVPNLEPFNAGSPVPGGAASTLSETSVATGTTTNEMSADPNALINPAGLDSVGFIQPTGNWSYTIDFDNDGQSAAQVVTVTEQLDPNLNWSTFQFGSFGFGSVDISVPPGLTQYQTTVTYQNSGGSPLDVDVALTFNVQTGLLTVTFTSLDPNTGQAPSGVFDGFLPPDNSSGIGEGYVQYLIQPKTDLATGTAIQQQANVVFDTNAPQATSGTVNTIDSVPPTSSVSALPSTEPTDSFLVSWSGHDDAGGSGLADYTIYVSDNGGSFTPWLSETTQTSATYTGVNGHTYGFYSIATDNVGNVEAAPAAAQATTAIDVITPAIASITSTTPAGTYGIGAVIDVTVIFDIPVTLAGGNLTIALNDGGTVVIAPFTNSTTAAGVYTVTGGQNAIALDSTAVTLAAGATFQDAYGISANLSIPAGDSLANNAGLAIDTMPPTINPIGTQVVADGSTLSFTVTGQSPDRSPVTFSLGVGAPAGAAINTQTGLFTWTPSEWNGQAPGTYTAIVIATNSNAPQLTSTATVTITVGASSSNQGTGLTSRTTVALGLTESMEYYTNLVTAAYQNYLGRLPAASELPYWTNQMLAGTLSDEELEAHFISSQEFINDHGGKPGQTWIQSLYQVFLGRSPQQSEINYWLNELAIGMPAYQVALGFATSEERESERVAADYQQYLGRSASQSEIAYWVNVFLAGGSNEQVVGGFLASQEYFQQHGDNIVDWLFAGYRAVLNRQPDMDGFQYWENQLQ